MSRPAQPRRAPVRDRTPEPAPPLTVELAPAAQPSEAAREAVLRFVRRCIEDGRKR